MDFTEEGHTITSGQPYDGAHMNGNDMDIKAGRHDSSAPAATYAQGLNVINMMGLSTAWPHLTLAPSKLNFVTYGTAIFHIDGKSYKCEDFRVGQGHSGTDNNWWIGSSKCFTIPDSGIFKCKCGSLLPPPLGGNLQFHPGDNDHM